MSRAPAKRSSDPGPPAPEPRDSGRSGRWLDTGLFVLALAVVAAMGFIRVSNADTGFHLVTGRVVLQRGAIPSTNVLSFTEPDHPWILHEWLSGVLFELAWRWGGAGGLLALKLVLLLMAFGGAFLAARRVGAPALAAAGATVLAAWASASRFVERPQVFSAAVLGVVLLLSARALACRARSSPWRPLLFAGLLVVVGFQLHAGAISSVALLLAVALGILLEPWRAGRFASVEPDRGRPAPDARRLRRLRDPGKVATFGRRAQSRGLARLLRRGCSDGWPFAAAGLGAMLVTAILLLLYHPHGAAPLWVPFALGADPELHSRVVEFRPAWAFPLRLLAPYWVLCALVAVGVVSRFRRTHAAWVIAAVLFLVLSLRHVRTIDAFALVSVPLVALWLDSLGGLEKKRWARWAAAAAVLALAAIAPLDQWQRFPMGPGLNRRVWPTDLFALMRREQLRGPAFVSDGWAGPFLAEFYPAERAFFDPRFEAYSRPFVQQVYRAIRYGEPGWDRLLDRYGVELLLLKYTSAGEARRQQGRPNLRQRALQHPDWALVAFNDHGELFVRRSGHNGAQAARTEIVGVDPDRGALFGPPAQTAASLQAAVSRGLHDNAVLLLAAVALAAANQPAAARDLLEQARAQDPDDPRLTTIGRAVDDAE